MADIKKHPRIIQGVFWQSKFYHFLVLNLNLDLLRRLSKLLKDFECSCNPPCDSSCDFARDPFCVPL